MGLFFESGLWLQDIRISMPHWTKYSCANCPFTIPPTICIHIGCQPRYLTMRHNELASNGGVATTSYHWILVQEWVIGWGICVRETEMGGATTYFVFVRECVCLCASEFTGSCSSQWVFGSVDNRPREKEMSNKVPGTSRNLQTDKRLVHLCRKVHTFAELKSHFLPNKHDYKLITHFSFLAAAGISFSINYQ